MLPANCASQNLIDILPKLVSSSNSDRIRFGEESSTSYVVRNVYLSAETAPAIHVEVDVDPNQAFACMIASEDILAKEWNTPEEDEAWADL